MTTSLLILTDFALRYPMRLQWWESYCIRTLSSELERNEVNPVLTHYEDPALFELVAALDISLCLPASSMLDGYRKLVAGTLPALAAAGVAMLPTLPCILAYDNKVAMTRLAQALRLPLVESMPAATAEGLSRAARTFGFPFVIKTPGGYGSSGVRLVSSEADLQQVLHYRFRENAAGSRGIGIVVAQRFIPNLAGDWKVIVVGDRAAALRRHVRPGDFRASGSHRFEWASPSSSLLEFAFGLWNRLRTPWVSLDIIEERPDDYSLIEFQCVHFGTTTTDKCPTHFQRNAAGTWSPREGPLPMEATMALAVANLALVHGRN